MDYEDLHLITLWNQVVQLRDNGLLTPVELALLEVADKGNTVQISLDAPNLKVPPVRPAEIRV